MRYILDTTVFVDHSLGRPGTPELVDRLLGESADLFVCDVIVTEALSKGTDAEVVEVGALLDALEYVSIPPEAARWAGEASRSRGATGPRGTVDALIAGLAWFMGATVVTRNPGDFKRMGVPVLAY